MTDDQKSSLFNIVNLDNECRRISVIPGGNFGKNSRNIYSSEMISNLPLDQSFEEVEAVAIALQLYELACRSILPTQLFRNQQTPISCDSLDSCSYASFCLECHDLICVEPVSVVHLFE